MIIIAFMLLLTGAMSTAMEKEEVIPKEETDPYEERVYKKFFEAVYAHKYKKVRWYLEDKLVNINRQNVLYDCNSLQWAAQNDDSEMITLLLEKGADINNAKNNNKHTALLLAAWHGSHKTLKLLLQKGAHVNKQNKFGDTPLHYAAEFKNRKKIELLLEYKANVEISNNKDITPWQLVKNKFIELPSWYQDTEGKKIMELIEQTVNKNKRESIKLQGSLRLKESSKEKEKEASSLGSTTEIPLKIEK